MVASLSMGIRRNVKGDSARAAFRLAIAFSTLRQEADWVRMAPTMTSNGVSNLVRYWFGDSGFGPYLEKLKQEGGSSGRT